MSTILFACKGDLVHDIENELDTLDNDSAASIDAQLVQGSGAFSHVKSSTATTDGRDFYEVDMAKVDAAFMQRLDQFMKKIWWHRGSFADESRIYRFADMIRAEYAQMQDPENTAEEFTWIVRSDIYDNLITTPLFTPDFFATRRTDGGDDAPGMIDPETTQSYERVSVSIEAGTLADHANLYPLLNEHIFADNNGTPPEDINARYHTIRDAIGIEGLHFYRSIEPELPYGYKHDTQGIGPVALSTYNGNSLRTYLLAQPSDSIPKRWLDAYLAKIQGDGNGGISFEDGTFTNQLDYWYGDEQEYYASFGNGGRISTSEFKAAAVAAGEDLESTDTPGGAIRTAVNHFKEETLVLDLITTGHGDPFDVANQNRVHIYIDPLADYIELTVDGAQTPLIYKAGEQITPYRELTQEKLDRAIGGIMAYGADHSDDQVVTSALALLQRHLPAI